MKRKSPKDLSSYREKLLPSSTVSPGQKVCQKLCLSLFSVNFQEEKLQTENYGR